MNPTLNDFFYSFHNKKEKHLALLIKNRSINLNDHNNNHHFGKQIDIKKRKASVNIIIQFGCKTLMVYI